MKLLQSLVALLATALVYMLTENIKFLRQVHSPRLEYLFWVGFTWCLASLLLLAEDAPIKIQFGSPLSFFGLFGITIPVTSAALVEGFMVAGLQQFRGFERQNTGNDVNIQIDPKDPNGLIQAQSKLRILNNLLDHVVFNSQIRMFTAWAKGMLKERRKKIQEVLMETTPEELNHIISSINVPQLFTYGNHYTNRNTNTLEYIITERGNDLSIIARASLLHGLMQMQTLVFYEQQLDFAIEALLGAKGSDLTLLKNLLDSSGDYNNLFKLVFVDINDEKQRKKVLDHVNIQAKETLRLNRAAGKRSIKILSDIDDTLFSSGGLFPAGADQRYPRHTVYPGVLTLFEEIDAFSRMSGKVLTKKVRKSIKRLSRKRRKEGVEDPKITSTDAEFEEQLEGLLDDHHEFEEAKPKALVSVELPWSQGGGIAQISFDPDTPIEKIQDEVERKFGVPPWKQSLVVTSDRPLYDNSDPQKWKHGNVVFISARPHAYKDITENGSYRKFHKLIGEGRMHATPTLLAGNMTTGLQAVVIRTGDELMVFLADLLEAAYQIAKLMVQGGGRRRRHENAELEMEDESRMTLQRIVTRIGGRETTNRNWYSTGLSKAEKFEQYALLFPEYSFVFFGDNGQGDLLAAEHMAQSVSGENLIKSFIHNILPPKKLERVLTSINPGNSEQEKRDGYGEHNIVFFDTYVGAAIEAYHSELIPLRGLNRVVVHARDEFKHMIQDSKHGDFDFTTAVEQMNNDLDRANSILADKLGNDFEPLPFVQY